MGLTTKSQQKALVKLTTLQKQWEAAVEKRPTLAVSSKDDYDKLVEAVEEATAKNESIGAFGERVKALGKSVKKLATTLGVLA